VVDPSKVTSLVIQPPADTYGVFDLTVTAVTAGGTVSTQTVPVVDLLPVSYGATFSSTAATTVAETFHGQQTQSLSLGTVTLTQNDTVNGKEFIVGDGYIDVTLSGASGATLTQNGHTVSSVGGVYHVAATGELDGTMTISGLEVDTVPAAYFGTETVSFGATLETDTGSLTDSYNNGVTYQSETSTTAISGSVSIDVTAQAQTPVITIAGSTVTDSAGVQFSSIVGQENSPLASHATALNATITLGTSDLVYNGSGNEEVSVVITGVPSGSLVSGASNNGDGSWTVSNGNVQVTSGTTAVLTGISITPPAYYAGTFDLGIQATVMQPSDESIATTTQIIPVTIDAIAYAPSITPTTAYTEKENVAVALALNLQTSVDSTQNVGVVLQNVSAGSSFTDVVGGVSTSVGEEIAVSTVGGVVTPVLDSSGHLVASSTSGVWWIPSADISSLYYQEPLGGTGSYTLEAQAWAIKTGTDPSGNVSTIAEAGGLTASGSTAEAITVAVSGVAHAATLAIATTGTYNTVATVVGTENTPIPINITAAVSDGNPNEALQIVISSSDLPSGSYFLTSAATGSQHITATSGSYYLTSAELPGLELVLPANWNSDYGSSPSGEISLTVTANTSVTNAADTADASATVSKTVAVDVQWSDVAPTLAVQNSSNTGVSAAQNVTGAVSSAITVIPTGDHLAITDVNGTQLSGMTFHLSGGLTGDALGLTGVTLATNASGNTIIAGTSIAVSYNAATETLSLSGTASDATYQQYADDVIVTNETKAMAAGTRTVTITATNAPQTITDTVTSTSSTQSATSTALSTNITIGDVTHDIGVTLSSAALGTAAWSVDASSHEVISFGSALGASAASGYQNQATHLSLGSTTATTGWVAISGVPSGATLTDSVSGHSLIEVALDGNGYPLLDASGTPETSTTSGVWLAPVSDITDLSFTDGNGSYALSAAVIGVGTSGSNISGIETSTPAASFTVTVTDPITLSNQPSTQTIAAGTHASPLELASSLTIADTNSSDSNTLHSLTIAVSNTQTGDSLGINGYALAVDPVTHQLAAVVNGTDVDVSYSANATNHTMSLAFSGNASTAVYTDLAQGVMLDSDSGTTLAAGSRSVSITATDPLGSNNSLTTTTTVSGTATLSSSAIGNIAWGADASGGVLNLHGSGTDTAVMVVGDAVTTINGNVNASINQLMMFDNDSLHTADWTLHLTDAQDVSASSASALDSSFTVHLTAGSVSVDSNNAHELDFASGSSGTITFTDSTVHSQVSFNHLDHIYVGV
jgi:hypothetical protein